MVMPFSCGLAGGPIPGAGVLLLMVIFVSSARLAAGVYSSGPRH